MSKTNTSYVKTNTSYVKTNTSYVKTNTSYVKTNKHAAPDARLKHPNTYKRLKPNPEKLINDSPLNNSLKLMALKINDAIQSKKLNNKKI